jgi:hypothetical protein
MRPVVSRVLPAGCEWNDNQTSRVVAVLLIPRRSVTKTMLESPFIR